MTILKMTGFAVSLLGASAHSNMNSRAVRAEPITPWVQVAKPDSGDALYRTARDAISNGDYGRAAQLFRQVAERYPKSQLVPDAMYWEAFSLYRSGAGDDLRAARDVLAGLRARYPEYMRKTDAASLATRVCGELAQHGDEGCAASITAQAMSVATAGTESRAAARVGRGTADPCPDEEDDDRVAALNALLQMDAARAEPVLEKVLARRDACSTALRRKAVFLVSQKRSPQALDVLLNVARTDPDAEVREQAVFWLAQVPGDRSVSVLNDILTKSADPGIREKAIFAISQNRSDQARQILRDYAENASAPGDLREKAIFWLGQQHNTDNTTFLRSLYGKLTDENLKEKTLFALSQRKDSDNGAWLVQIAQNRNENNEMRKKALFYAGQAGVSVEQLVRLYDSLVDSYMREQMIFVLSQRQEPAALNKLISIARADKDPEARKKAVFWLGQSRDPRATQALTEMINK